MFKKLIKKLSEKKSSIRKFVKDESGFDLVQFSVYTAVAVGALAVVWFAFLKDRIHTAGETTGGIIEKGYQDAQNAVR